MRISRVEIKNFRSIKHLDVDLDDTTVLVGPNNAGKTAILDAIRIVLNRRWGKRGTGFSEYDIHMEKESSDPKDSAGITIEIRTEEKEVGEWPEVIIEDLANILQVDINTSLRSVCLRVRYAWDESTENFESSWEFVDAGHEPLIGIGSRKTNMEPYWRYLPMFYLDALRNAKDEFSVRSSQFWTPLLKDLNIPQELEFEASQILDELNAKLLESDPRLTDITEILSNTARVATHVTEGEANLRMVPLKIWDLLSRAEIILRNSDGLPWFPLMRQGQGLRSLSVIFLFQAFIKHLLREHYEAESEPLLALEEPEAHLHPQAVRTLWHHVNALPGQKILSTHSPYFIQQVSLRSLRMVRLQGGQTVVHSLPRKISVAIPESDGLEEIVRQSKGKLKFESFSGLLSATESIDEEKYRDLLKCYASHQDRARIHQNLKNLKKQATQLINDSELQKLETSAKRMRGEIFFAEQWLLVEGQTDYLLVRSIAQALDCDLDRYGVSIIDVQNNGDPATFAALANTFDISWLAVFDGDKTGLGYVEKIAKRLDLQEPDAYCKTHPDGDLEQQIVIDGLKPEIMSILDAIGINNSQELSDIELVDALRNNKSNYAWKLAEQFVNGTILPEKIPTAFKWAIEKLQGLQS